MSDEAARTIDELEAAARFGEAADKALCAGDAPRALRLAARTADDALLVRAARALDPSAARRLGMDLAARGYVRAAAHAFDAAGATVEAAEAWARANEPTRAAERFVAAGEMVRAARVLSARLRDRSDDDESAVALGRVFLASGRADAAARALQRVSASSPHHAEARSLLARALDDLGLLHARASLGDVAPANVERHVTEPLLFGRYEVVRQVATTPSARVVEAIDRVTNERVAVKVLRPPAAGAEGLDAIARFEREASVLGALRHPHVVPLRAFVESGPAVVLPWMPGGSLAERLARGGLAPGRAVEIVLAILSALGEAHRLGILHRDVKPSNVLFDASGAPHLADFGAAHVGDAAATVTVGLIGSLAYMAPEQRLGVAASVASDVYAAGAVLLEALTGMRPVAADDVRVKPSDVHPALGKAHDDAVLALVARDPARRPESAEAASELLAKLSWRGERGPPTRTSERPPRPRGARLEVDCGGALFDTTLSRRVRILPADEANVKIARAFVRADHPALATILRLDPATASLWVEEPGTAMGDAQKLTSIERARLAEALARLHREGVAHGRVDPVHVRRHETRGVLLAFPSSVRALATAESDLVDLGRLTGSTQAPGDTS